MRKFENLTDFELLNGAYGYYLDEWAKSVHFCIENPDDRLSKLKEARYEKIVDELHDRIVEIMPRL